MKSDSIFVIVGSFKNQYNAIYLERDLRKKGFKNATSLNRKNGFYRVSIERFSDLAKAKNFIEENQLKKSEFWYQYSNGQIIKNYDENLGGAGVHKPETRKKSGERFINCLKRSNIEFLHVYPHEIFESKLSKKHMILSQKIWVFKNATDKNLKNFKKIWYEK